MVALRSIIGLELQGAGGVGAVGLPRENVEARLEQWGGRLSIAVENGPSSVLVAGDRDALGELIEQCRTEGARTKRFPTDFASHSASGGGRGHRSHSPDPKSRCASRRRETRRAFRWGPGPPTPSLYAWSRTTRTTPSPPRTRPRIACCRWSVRGSPTTRSSTHHCSS
ncbi:acyltransferase domain-containing protein [Streptomyces sp. NPDC056061]|uniref:acyltransferase domain-containing protein n=1 Tax=Streptomyces sp. NPDC056061 TaxID=3345700 RepID=UPI0035D5EE7D